MGEDGRSYQSAASDDRNLHAALQCRAMFSPPCQALSVLGNRVGQLANSAVGIHGRTMRATAPRCFQAHDGGATSLLFASHTSLLFCAAPGITIRIDLGRSRARLAE